MPAALTPTFALMTTCLLASCAATSSAPRPAEARSTMAFPEARTVPSAVAEARAAAPADLGLDAGAAFAIDPADLAATTSMTSPYSLARDPGLRKSRFTLKGGVWSEEDASELDDGWIANVSWMRFFTSLLALELELGYFDSDGSNAGIRGEVQGIPIMVNGRVNLPVWVIDLYAGAGVGTIYYDVDVGTMDDDGFLFAGNAFIGGTVNVADKIAVGLEGKYYATEDIDRVNASLDGIAVMVTLGFAR